MARIITIKRSGAEPTEIWGVPLVWPLPMRDPSRWSSPGRRAVRDVEESRAQWIHYHDVAKRDLLRYALSKLPADASEERREKLQQVVREAELRPYVREIPRLRKRRGAFKRALLRRLATPRGQAAQ